MKAAGTRGRLARHLYDMRRDAFREMVPRAVSAIALAVLACCALGALSPAARADGDPGSDVLVYQNLFVAADANISIAQQVELGDLLTSASRDGFTIRVAIVAQPADLGAITALWRKPASYASFLGIELSLAYSQRLLVVMPDGFGFNWQGHSAGAAYQVLGKIAVKPGGTGLAASAETAVRALAAASGVRLAAPAAASQPERGGGSAGGGTTGNGAAGQSPPSTRPPCGDRPGVRPPRLAHRRHRGCGAGRDRGRRLARAARRAPASGAARDGARLCGLDRSSGPGALPRLAVPGTWLAGGFVAVAVALIAVHAVLSRRPARRRAAARRRTRAWRATPTSTRGRPCPPSRPASPSPTSSASRCRSAPTGARS